MESIMPDLGCAIFNLYDHGFIYPLVVWAEGQTLFLGVLDLWEDVLDPLINLFLDSNDVILHVERLKSWKTICNHLLLNLALLDLVSP